ncbi:MAG TPA: SpoIIE family protein phosphatase [Bacteroidia bacterium]|nr:SpoIIE family protein phosphatase [Bacteroidia bacterium]
MRRLIPLLFLCLLPFSGYSQDRERLRTSLAKLETPLHDTMRVLMLNNVGWDTAYDNLAIGLRYGEQSLELAEKINYERGIIRACNTIGTVYEDMGDHAKAIAFHLRGLSISERIGSIGGMRIAHMNIAIVYESLGELDKVINHLLISVDLHKFEPDTESLCMVNANLGSAYLKADSLDKAKERYKLAMSYAEGAEYSLVRAGAMSGLAKCYHADGDSAQADKLALEALQIFDSLGADYDLSMEQALYAGMLADRGSYTLALKYLQEAMTIFKRVGMRQQEKDGWELIARIYEGSGRTADALKAMKRYVELKDSLLTENTLRHQNDLEAIYENKKRKAEIELLTKDKTLQQTYITGLAVGFSLLLGFLFVLTNRAKLRKRTNIQLARQNAIIEEKNKDITDSITYARRIQEAVLPSSNELKSKFTDLFIFYRPRDIVSGDFWWFTENENKFFLAVADCTGHGVPGGFMSVMGAAFLSEIINEKRVSSPEEILNLLRSKVTGALQHAGEDDRSVKDGMDIAMLTFDATHNHVQFACANNPVWLVRNGQLTESRADKFPVGVHTGAVKPFTRQELEVQKGDMLYLFTDGYADQFGGPAGKKLKYKKMKEMLKQIGNLSAEEQHHHISNEFDTWKGNLGQVDDVCIIGLRI